MTYRDPFPLALYAFPTSETAGRRYPEPPHPYRGAFQRDRDRIIHCAAFRRLSEKMQVFTAEFGSYHRTRLTHTMEVVGVARTIGRALQLNEDLIEAAALLHDIGHSPFGHAGENVLDMLLRDCGGFEHNAQALRIVEKLERRYTGFPGLNLSKEIVEGQAYKVSKTVVPLLEIQAVDIADSIAYDTHDVDDAMELGLLTTEQLMRTSLWKRSAHRVRGEWSNLNDTEFRRAVVHDLIETQVSDVLQATAQRLERQQITDGWKDSRRQTADGSRGAPAPLVSATVCRLLSAVSIAPSSEIAEQKREMEQFLMEHVYRHPNVMMCRRRVADWIETIFDYYASHSERLPERYDAIIQQEGTRRAAADYVADQTDRSIRSELLKLNPRRVG
ncbi:MAG: dNTP triphosphohydrolase [Planctomycetaceae bacterium]|nr:dNTP triphosphohydrolase [Planctomycetaceae bacterium]